MTANKLMTYGAIAFAAFALYQFNRRPGQAIANQPGQQQRDAGLAAWNDLQVSQWSDIAAQVAQEQRQFFY